MNKNFIALAAAAGIFVLALAIYTSRTPSNTPPSDAPQSTTTSETKPDTSAKPAEGDDAVLATYSGTSLHKSEINQKLNALFGEKPQGERANFDQLPDNVKENIIRNMVAGKLIAAEASKIHLENDPAVQRQLVELKEQLVQKEFLVRKMKSEVTDAKLRERYDQFSKEFENKEEIKARHILVATEQEAKDVKDALAKGKAFDDLAKEKSKDPNKDKGGDLGYFTKGQMVKPFEDAAFALQVGQISEPIKTDFGWHIIKLEDRRKVPVPPFEQVKEQLENELGQKLVQDYVDELLKNAQFQPTFKK